MAEAIASFAALIAAAASAGADGAACCDVVSAAAALDGGLDPALEGAFVLSLRAIRRLIRPWLHTATTI